MRAFEKGSVKIKSDWAVVVFLALCLVGHSAGGLWTYLPYKFDDPALESSPGADLVVQLFSESNKGWRGRSASTGYPLWIPIAAMGLSLGYMFIWLMLRRRIERLIPVAVLAACLLLSAGDLIVTLVRGGELGLGLAAAGVACLLGLGVLLLAPSEAPPRDHEILPGP